MNGNLAAGQQLGVGGECANVAETHDDKCKCLKVDVHIVVVHSEGNIIGSTAHEEDRKPELQEAHPEIQKEMVMLIWYSFASPEAM